MYREIKFRVWNGKKMITWDVLRNLKTVLLSKILEGLHLDYIPMQYTGLKDKNGKEIYEGDILEFPQEESIIKVHWDITGACRYFDVLNLFMDDGHGRGDWRFTMGIAKNSTIIGNMYENPELLS